MDKSTAMRIRLHYELHRRDFAVVIVEMGRGRTIRVAEAPSMVAVESHVMVEPTMRLDDDGAQQLMNDLWNAGIRPSHAGSASDIIEAKDVHLKDMREHAMTLSDHIAALLKKVK